MPLHDVGYRTWEPSSQGATLRWWVIAQTGIWLAWKSQWLRRMLFVAWLPSIYLGVSLFAYEQSAVDHRSRLALPVMLSQLPHSEDAMERIMANPTAARREVWGLVLLTLFRYPQGVLMVLLIGIIAPPLIANDLRTRAYLLYFSRPIERWDYLFGKSLVVWTYLFLVTALPALSLYVLGVGLSPSLDVVAYTWDLPLRILAASVWLILPTTALALCFSSMTSESRYAGFAWFAMWVLGWVAYVSLTLMDLSEADNFVTSAESSRWALVSLYHTLGRVQMWVFGLEQDVTDTLPAIGMLVSLTVLALAVLTRRITAPLRT